MDRVLSVRELTFPVSPMASPTTLQSNTVLITLVVCLASQPIATAGDAAWQIADERLADHDDENWPIPYDATGIKITRDIVLGSPGGRDITMDLFEPAKRDRAALPCIIVIHGKKCLVLERIGRAHGCEFSIDPSGKNSHLINPALVIRNWGQDDDISITIDGESVSEKDVRMDLINGNELLIWIHETIDSESTFSISPN